MKSITNKSNNGEEKISTPRRNSSYSSSFRAASNGGAGRGGAPAHATHAARGGVGRGAASNGGRPRAPAPKRTLLCSDNTADLFGQECSCSRGNNCGYAHGISNQNPTQEHKYLLDLIKKGQAGDDKSFQGFMLSGGDQWVSKNVESVERLSKVCPRFLKTLRKHKSGELTKSDLCPGGLNCMAGVCGDRPDFDISKSFLLDKGDWYSGVPDGTGIRLTQFGLIPLEEQQRIAAKKKKEEEIKAIFSDPDAFPSLGGGYSAPMAKPMAKPIANPKNVFSSFATLSDSEDEAADSEDEAAKPKSEHKWEETDWQTKANEAEELELDYGEKVLHHNGDVYKYTLHEGENLSYLHGKPIVATKLDYSTRITTFRSLESEREKAAIEKQAAFFRKLGMPSVIHPYEDEDEDEDEDDDYYVEEDDDQWLEEDDDQWDDEDEWNED